MSGMYCKFKYKLSCFSFCRDTYVEREPGESANDRNDRAIRTACKWYQKHLDLSTGVEGGVKVKVVLLTNDIDNRNKAQQDGITALKGMWGKTMVVDFHFKNKI